MPDTIENIRDRFNRSFVLTFLVNLLVTTLVAITALSYIEANGEFSPARGLRVFASFFGGFWGMAGTLLALVLVAVAIGYALWATDTMHRTIAGVIVLVILVLAALFGKGIFSGFPVGKLVTLAVFLTVVVVETIVEIRIVRNHRAAARRTAPVTPTY